MFEVTKFSMPVRSASAFMSPGRTPDARGDIWADAGHGIELAFRGARPIGATSRAVIVLALVVAAKLCLAAIS